MADGPSRRNDALHYGVVALAFVLATIHFYLGLVVESPGNDMSIRFLLVGTIFLAGVVVYLTSYFRPVLYLLGSLYAGVLGVLWFLGGMQYFSLGLLTGVVGGSFLLLTVYLFVRDEMATG
jgi:hypothetical protein